MMKIATAMRINVTEAHIECGLPGSADCCPIALAIAEQVPYGCDVTVRFTRASVGGDEFWLPAEAKDFINQFDAGAYVEPFSFALVDRAL